MNQKILKKWLTVCIVSLICTVTYGQSMDKLEDSLKIAKENSDISESIRLAGKIVEKTEIIYIK